MNLKYHLLRTRRPSIEVLLIRRLLPASLIQVKAMWRLLSGFGLAARRFKSQRLRRNLLQVIQGWGAAELQLSSSIEELGNDNSRVSSRDHKAL